MMIVVIGAVVVAAKERHHSQVLTPPLVPYGILDVERGRSPARISCRGVEDTVSCP